MKFYNPISRGQSNLTHKETHTHITREIHLQYYHSIFSPIKLNPAWIIHVWGRRNMGKNPARNVIISYKMAVNSSLLFCVIGQQKQHRLISHSSSAFQLAGRTFPLCLFLLLRLLLFLLLLLLLLFLLLLLRLYPLFVFSDFVDWTLLFCHPDSLFKWSKAWRKVGWADGAETEERRGRREEGKMKCVCVCGGGFLFWISSFCDGTVYRREWTGLIRTLVINHRGAN